MLFVPTMPRLGSTKLAGAAATTSTVTIPAKDFLYILVAVTGYGGADIASLRFNGDTGNNYWTRHTHCSTTGTAATGTMTVNTNATTNFLRLASQTATNARFIGVFINNMATVAKPIRMFPATGTGSVGTIGIDDMGTGEWVNTTAQITSVVLTTAGGQNLNSGTGLIVYGDNM